MDLHGHGIRESELPSHQMLRKGATATKGLSRQTADLRGNVVDPKNSKQKLCPTGTHKETGHKRLENLTRRRQLTLHQWHCGVVVITLDFESNNPSSTLGSASHFSSWIGIWGHRVAPPGGSLPGALPSTSSCMNGLLLSSGNLDALGLPVGAPRAAGVMEEPCGGCPEEGLAGALEA